MAISNLHKFSNSLAIDFEALKSNFITYFNFFETFLYQNRWQLIFFIKIYQIMARRSKKIGFIKAISANFDFSPNPASRLDCEILEQFGKLFIEDSEWPSQNLCKNILRRGVEHWLEK